VNARLGPGETFGRYRIESELGRGGMSVVYLAQDPSLARQVAIKVLAPELAADAAFRSRFIRESQLAAGLDHPNIVPVYEAGEVDGDLFIAMRYVRGTDLRSLIAGGHGLEPERIAELIRPIAGALDAAHRRGLVHRDVKPANILIALDEGEEHPYLADFGLTKHTSSKSGLTKTGTFMGTVDYVAPEQIQGAEVDGRTDEYSLACVLFQCLTGVVPFDKGTDVATLFAHLQDPLPKVSTHRTGTSPELDAVLERGMAKDRDERYPTCVAMVDAFVRAAGVRAASGETPLIAPTVVAAGAGAAMAGSGEQLPPAPAGAPSVPPVLEPPKPKPAPAPSKGPNRKVLVAIGAAAGLVIVVGVAILLLTGGDSEPSPPPQPTGPSPPTTIPQANAITIPKAGPGTPYPSTIEVSDMRGVVTDVNVTLDGLTHGFPTDLDAVLVGPDGTSVSLMAGVGGFAGATDLTVTFDDDGPALTANRQIQSGTFRPSSSADDDFSGPPPAPSGPYGTALSVFDGTDPNGTWQLFVFDDSARDGGQISDGWALHLELGSAAQGTGPSGASGAANVIHQDDFSDPSSGFDVFNDGQAHGLYQNGTYVMGIAPSFRAIADTNTSTSQLSTLTDVRVRATGRLRTGNNGLWGVVCRAATSNDYYYFLVQADGTYYIGRSSSAPQPVNFATGFSPSINPGRQPNTVTAECVDGEQGVTLRMFVNDVPVDTAVDSNDPLASGAVGFRVESDDRKTEAAFDDLVVSRPD
jgi:serine/threonine protein kinase/subtilisin-like proprotein convertase family protein